MTSVIAWAEEYVKDQNGRPHNNLANAAIALTRSPELREAFGHYIADDNVYIYGPLLGSGWPDEPRKLTERHVNSVRLHMQAHCGLPVIMARDVRAAIRIHADKNPFTYSSEEGAHVYMWERVYDIVKPGHAQNYVSW